MGSMRRLAFTIAAVAVISLGLPSAASAKCIPTAKIKQVRFDFHTGEGKEPAVKYWGNWRCGSARAPGAWYHELMVVDRRGKVREFGRSGGGASGGLRRSGRIWRGFVQCRAFESLKRSGYKPLKVFHRLTLYKDESNRDKMARDDSRRLRLTNICPGYDPDGPPSR